MEIIIPLETYFFFVLWAVSWQVLKVSLPPQSIRKPFGKAGFRRIPYHHLRCLVPGGAGLQSGFDLSHQGIVDHHARFEVQRIHLKYPLLTTRFRPIKEKLPYPSKRLAN
jgi:hypothetical protein